LVTNGTTASTSFPWAAAGSQPVQAWAAPGVTAVENHLTVEVTRPVTVGYRASKLLGTPVYNELEETVGNIDDLIITPHRTLSLAILSVRGFLGLGRRLVAIPADTPTRAPSTPARAIAHHTRRQDDFSTSATRLLCRELVFPESDRAEGERDDHEDDVRLHHRGLERPEEGVRT
jgi:hypothetical protein